MSDFSLYIWHSYSSLKSVLSGISDLISHVYCNICTTDTSKTTVQLLCSVKCTLCIQLASIFIIEFITEIFHFPTVQSSKRKFFIAVFECVQCLARAILFSIMFHHKTCLLTIRIKSELMPYICFTCNGIPLSLSVFIILVDCNIENSL